jgi:hypothetical protein
MNRLCLLLFFVLLKNICSSQIHGGIKDRPQSSVEILHVEPEQPVEGMPVIIYFRFYNRTSSNLSGWIGADINSLTGTPGQSSVDWEVKDLPSEQYVDGAVFVRAPNAGINRLIRVFYYNTKTVNDGHVSKSQPMFRMGEQSLDVAALISFSLKQFRVNHTRARSTDTDYGSLYVSKNDQPVMQPCSKFLGNLQDGLFSFNSDQDRQAMASMNKQLTLNQAYSVAATSFATQQQQAILNNVFDSGPFAVVPDRNSVIKPVFFIYNGGSVVNTNDFLKGFAEATANPQLFNGPRPGRATWFDVMRVLCPPLNVVGACDGFVVADSMLIQSNDLFNVTGTGNAVYQRNFSSEEFASQTGCGNTSNYDVECVTKRISHAGMMENVSPIYTSVTANQRINLFSNISNSQDIVWQRVETIASDGSFTTTADPAYGYVESNKYVAPADVPRSLLVILRGVRPQLVIDNDEYDVFAGSELRLVTAIVQLIPGQRIMNPVIFNTRPDAQTEPTPPPTPPTPTKKGKDKIITNHVKTGGQRNR